MAAKRGPRTIRGMVAVVAGVSGALNILVGLLTYSLVHEEIERQLDHRIELETRSLLYIHEHGGMAAMVQAVQVRDRAPTRAAIGYLADSAGVDAGMGYMVLDAQGRRLAGRLAAAVPPPGWSEFVHFTRPDGTTGIAQAMNGPVSGGGRLIVAADRAGLAQIDLSLLKLFLINFSLVLAIGVAAAIGFGRIVRRRLGAIKGAAEMIMAGDFSRRMTLDGSDGEFDQLAQVLNRMLDRIGALMDNLRQVSGDIAHDLRTPLGRLRSRLDELEEAKTASARRQGLRVAVGEVEALQDLLSGILALSEIEGQTVRERFGVVALDGAITELAEAYGPALDAAGLTLRLDLEPSWLTGDERLLQRAIANLLDNSLTHARGATAIDIRLQRAGERITLSFADDGPGVAIEARGRIFERFVRLDPARSEPGHGLGLSIVSAIIAAHGGTITTAPTSRGLTLEIDLLTTSPLG
ncbi:sensor histidine kinase [Caulobacter soli]|uniref:sensor histidine kinase n=1 Tax=Caulobacter soli TaxID=2708539 RepID=UPI0013ED4165|nr:ATP-binding protein [Caulobacter soli]